MAFLASRRKVFEKSMTMSSKSRRQVVVMVQGPPSRSNHASCFQGFLVAKSTARWLESQREEHARRGKGKVQVTTDSVSSAQVPRATTPNGWKPKRKKRRNSRNKATTGDDGRRRVVGVSPSSLNLRLPKYFVGFFPCSGLYITSGKVKLNL